MNFALKNKQKGFSLVELMVVVGIIGVLTAIAVPRYQLFQARAKQAEAKINLAHIHMMQTTYHMDNNTYATTLAQLSINLQRSGGTSATAGKYYNFTLAGVSATGFTSDATTRANGVLASCQTGADVWRINADKQLTNPTNGLATCN